MNFNFQEQFSTRFIRGKYQAPPSIHSPGSKGKARSVFSSQILVANAKSAQKQDFFSEIRKKEERKGKKERTSNRLGSERPKETLFRKAWTQTKSLQSSLVRVECERKETKGALGKHPLRIELLLFSRKKKKKRNETEC